MIVEQCVILHNNLSREKKGPLSGLGSPQGAVGARFRIGYDGLCVKGNFWKVYVEHRSHSAC